MPTPAHPGHAEPGAVTHQVACLPCALPPVRAAELEAAWDAARQAAIVDRWGTPRRFRFQPPDGTPTELLLKDRDAACWAAAVERTASLHTTHGLSLCLRLLALVDLLAHAPWTAPLCRVRRSGAELHPALLRAAACAELTNEARFDETRLRAELGPHAVPNPAPPPSPAPDGAYA